LPGTYKTVGGENWSGIARSTTGNDLDAAAIRRANPSLQEPLSAGKTIQIPNAAPPIVSAREGDLSISVNGQRVGTFNDFELAMAIDAISKCSFVVPNEHVTRAIFMPLLSQKVTVDLFGQRLFTGRCESPRVMNSSTQKSMEILCYSDPGVLERCTPSIEKFPLEWKKALLEQITLDLCSEHGIGTIFLTPTTSLFKRVNIEPSQNVLEFITDLAIQRGLFLKSNEYGQLVLHKEIAAGKIVSFLETGKHPTESVSLNIDESRYYSSVTGIVPAKSKRGKIGAKFTVRNPFATDVIRAYTFECKDIDSGELPVAVSSAAGRMFAELISCGAELATWNNGLGQVYQPGQLVLVKSEEDFITKPFKFIVTSVVLQKTAGATTASLSLSLPGAYSGQIPTRLPWL
jgi:prophage tail gpP-like protein